MRLTWMSLPSYRQFCWHRAQSQSRGRKDPPENKDLLGHRVLLDHQALLDHKALPARKDLPAWQARPARLVHRGLLALLVLPGLKEK